jgi:hypothetical protein
VCLTPRSHDALAVTASVNVRSVDDLRALGQSAVDEVEAIVVGQANACAGRRGEPSNVAGAEQEAPELLSAGAG